MTAIALVVALALLAALAVLQILAASGLPLGRFGWGGQHRVLPRGLRVASAASVLVYAGLAALLLSRAGVLPAGGSTAVMDRLSGAGAITTEVVRQDGKPDRKVHSLTDAGRAELTDWLSSPVEEDLPKEPFLARLFFAALIGREGVERMLDERERQMNEASTTLSSLSTSSDDLMGLLQTATLRNGLVHAEAEREWLRETRASLLGLAEPTENSQE